MYRSIVVAWSYLCVGTHESYLDLGCSHCYREACLNSCRSYQVKAPSHTPPAGGHTVVLQLRMSVYRQLLGTRAIASTDRGHNRSTIHSEYYYITNHLT